MTSIQLTEIASARSGDKGGNANVGLWTDTPERYEVLRAYVTADAVAAHFARLCRGPVIRYELPKLWALNFLLHDALDGGGTVSLRTDAQGKTMSLGLLQLRIEVPDEVAARIVARETPKEQ